MDCVLTVTIWDEPGARPRRYTLRGDPPGGDHPHPEAACAAIDRGEAPFAPVPPGTRCLEVWSGPQRATVEGTWRGAAVSAHYSRVNSCESARWNALAPVFGTPDPS